MNTANRRTGKIILGIAGVLLTVALLFSITGCQEEAPEDRGSKGILYEVRGGDGEVYLFGSVHAGDESMYPLRTEVTEAFDTADVVGFEVDLELLEGNWMDDLLRSVRLGATGTYTDGTVLSDHIDEELYREVVEFFSEYGIPESAVEDYRPGVLAGMIEDLSYEGPRYSAEYGVEMVLRDRVENQEVIALETIEEQMAIALLLSPESEEILLRDALDHAEDGGNEIEEIIKAWKAGNREYLQERREEQITEGMTESLVTYHKALTDDRDERMAMRIDRLLQNREGERIFLVVGSLHLVGENGIPNQLRELGYEVIER